MIRVRNFALALLVLLAAMPARGQVERNKIARIDLNGAIDPVTAGFVVRSITRAEEDQAQFLLIRLQTPGGFGSSVRNFKQNSSYCSKI